MCRHVLTGVDFCGSVYLLIGHRNALENAFLRAHKPENRLKTFCFCFLRRGPGPSEVAGGLTLTERSKTLRPMARPDIEELWSNEAELMRSWTMDRIVVLSRRPKSTAITSSARAT